MSIDPSKYPTGTESSRLHGLSFGVLDAARKIHSQIEQHLGLPVTDKPTTAGDVEAMLDEAGAMMTRMMRLLESGPFAESDQSAPEETPPATVVPVEPPPAGDAAPAPAV
jgi:hypothetical protein